MKSIQKHIQKKRVACCSLWSKGDRVIAFGVQPGGSCFWTPTMVLGFIVFGPET
jgi:hypothetical protein